MSNSTLVDFTRLSPNHSGKRKYPINRITPHCVVGQMSVEMLGNIFSKKERQASCQYGIGADGRVGLYCDEANRSWCSSSADNDNRAVTIECASDRTHPYAFNSVVYQKLIDLCADICIRNGKTKLLWIPDKATALSYKLLDNEMLLTVHRWFANKSCPGDWLYARLGEVANKVNEKINTTLQPHATNYHEVQKKYEFSDSTMEYLGNYKWADSLFTMMLQDKTNQKYQLNTINYILKYEYGKAVFDRLFN